MPGQTTTRRPGRPRTAAVLAAAVLAVGLAGPAAAPAAAAAPAPLPPPPPCATAISAVSGTVTSPPTPLPAATSQLGGGRLSRPGLQADLPLSAARPPALRATAWLVADLDTGNVLAACNAHVPLAPASTLKILTSLTLAHRLDWAARYIGQPADAATDGTRVGIVPGSSYTVTDLFHGLMLNSGNDAATALATLAGGMPATAALMNDTAHRLGAYDTVAVNDSGLDAAGQVTSAYDLALLGRAALADPLVARLVSTRTYGFPGKEGGPGPRKPFQIQNHNGLLFNYPGATGVKNGYTTAAGGSFVGSATRGGHRYLVTLLRADIGTWHLARDLLDWAFAAGPQASPVGRLVTAGEVPDPTARPSVTAPGGTAAPAAALGGSGRAAAAVGTADDTRTGWMVLGGLAVLLLGGIGAAGTARSARGARSAGGARARTPGARRGRRAGR